MINGKYYLDEQAGTLKLIWKRSHRVSVCSYINFRKNTKLAVTCLPSKEKSPSWFNADS